MQAIEGLIEEHRCIEKMLDALEKIDNSLEEGEIVDYRRINHLLELITDMVEKIHHGKEENILFPLMEKYGYKKDAPPVKSLLADHDNGRIRIKAIKASMPDYENNQDPIIENAKPYIDLLRLHIKKEDALFRALDKSFKQEDQAMLLQKCRELEMIVVKQGRRAECIIESEKL